MANNETIVEREEAMLVMGEAAVEKIREMVHGDRNTVVETDTGPVPSLKKWQADAGGFFEAAAERAEAARDASLIQAGLAVDEPTGRAAVANGQSFKVQGVGAVAAYEYRRISAASSVLIATYPSKSAYDSIADSLGAKADVAPGKNLLNPADPDVALGFFPNNTTGRLQANVSYNASGYIPVVAGTTYTLSTKHYAVWYDASKTFISGSDNSDTAKTRTAPAGAAFLRCSASAGNEWASFQVEANTGSTLYEPYGKWILPQAIKGGSLTSDKLADKGVTPDKVSFIQLGKNLFDKSKVTLGKFMDNAGALSTSATYNVSDYIPVTPGAQYYGRSATDGMRMLTYFNAAKVVVVGGSNSDVSGFTVPAGVAYVRISVYVSSQDSFQFEVGSVATLYENFQYILKLADGRSVVAVPADGGISTNKLADRAVTPEKTNFLKRSKNLFDTSTVTVGNFMGADGALTTNAKYNVSDYIPVTPGAQYYGRSATDGMRMLTYFNAAKVVVVGGSNSDVSGFTVPAGVAYARITVYATTQDSFQLEVGSVATSYSKAGYVLKLDSGAAISVEGGSVSSSRWEGKTWSGLGDSITAAGLWQAIVSSKLGLSHTNFGFGGTKLSGVDAKAMCQDTRVNAIPATQDLITCMGGTNDWAQNVPLGATDSSDPLTFYGALNTLIGKLMARFPAKRVALFTTPYGEIYDFAKRGWPNAYTNTQGLTTRDYAEAVRVVCKRWGLPCVDVQANAGWNALNIRTYLNDDGALLHPNATGAARVAEVVIGNFRSIEPIA